MPPRRKKITLDVAPVPRRSIRLSSIPSVASATPKANYFSPLDDERMDVDGSPRHERTVPVYSFRHLDVNADDSEELETPMVHPSLLDDVIDVHGEDNSLSENYDLLDRHRHSDGGVSEHKDGEPLYITGPLDDQVGQNGVDSETVGSILDDASPDLLLPQENSVYKHVTRFIGRRDPLLTDLPDHPPAINDCALLRFDGGNRNQNTSAAGVVLYSIPNKYGNREILHRRGLFLQDNGTNNKAEYLAFLAALTMARDFGLSTVLIEGDSQLVIEQVSGDWDCNSSQLQELLELIRNFDHSFVYIGIRHLSRDFNSDADACANKAMDVGADFGLDLPAIPRMRLRPRNQPLARMWPSTKQQEILTTYRVRQIARWLLKNAMMKCRKINHLMGVLVAGFNEIVLQPHGISPTMFIAVLRDEPYLAYHVPVHSSRPNLIDRGNREFLRDRLSTGIRLHPIGETNFVPWNIGFPLNDIDHIPFHQTPLLDSPPVSSLPVNEFISLFFRAGTTSIRVGGPTVNKQRALITLQYRRIIDATLNGDSVLQMRRLKEAVFLNFFMHPLMSDVDAAVQKRDFESVMEWGFDDRLDLLSVAFVETYISRRKIANATPRHPKSLERKIHDLLAEGLVGDAFTLLQKAKILPCDEIVVQQLHLKFPQNPPPELVDFDLGFLEPGTEPPPPLAKRIIHTNAAIKKIIRKGKRRTNPGIFGLRIEHLKAYASSCAKGSDAFVEALSSYEHLFHFGQLPLEWIQMVHYFTLLALAKDKMVDIQMPDETIHTVPDLRPISMVPTQYKGPQQAAFRHSLESIRDKLGSRSTGLMRCGTEFTIHMLRIALRNPAGTVFTLDQQNAYGLCNRGQAYSQFAADFPSWQLHLQQLSQITPQLLGRQPNGDYIKIPLVCGYPQGGPLVPALYSNSSLPALKRAHNIVQTGENGEKITAGIHGYIDDTSGYTCSPDVRSLSAAIDAFAQEIKGQGAKFNGSKCFIAVGDDVESQSLEELKVVLEDALGMSPADIFSNVTTKDTSRESRGIKILGVS